VVRARAAGGAAAVALGVWSARTAGRGPARRRWSLRRATEPRPPEDLCGRETFGYVGHAPFAGSRDETRPAPVVSSRPVTGPPPGRSGWPGAGLPVARARARA